MTSSNGNISSVAGPLWGEPPVTDGFPSQRTATRGFHVFFDLCLNLGKRPNKQSRHRHHAHYDVTVICFWLLTFNRLPGNIQGNIEWYDFVLLYVKPGCWRACKKQHIGLAGWTSLAMSFNQLSLLRRSRDQWINPLWHNCITWCIVTCSATSHYLNQYWLVVTWAVRSKLQCNSIHLFHYNDVIMSPMASQITSLTMFTQPFTQTQIKEHIKAPCHWPLWGEFTGHRWIPRTKGQ